MPYKDSPYRDSQGRTFDQYVADRVMAAIIAAGMSVREVAAACGLNRSTLQRRVNNDLPFTTRELGAVAVALGVNPADFALDY